MCQPKPGFIGIDARFGGFGFREWDHWCATYNINGDIFVALSNFCIYRVQLGRLNETETSYDGLQNNLEPELDLYAGISYSRSDQLIPQDGKRFGEAVFGKPSGMDATNDERGRIWVADERAHTVRVVVGNSVKTAAGIAPELRTISPSPTTTRDGDALTEAILFRPTSVLYLFASKTVVIAERGRKALRLLNLKTMKVTTLDLNMSTPSVDLLRIYSSQLLQCPTGPVIIRLLDTKTATTHNVDILTGSTSVVDQNLLPLSTYLRDDKIITLWYGKHTNWMQWDLGLSIIDANSETGDSVKNVHWLEAGPSFSWMFYVPRHNCFVGCNPSSRGLSIMPRFLKTKEPNLFPTPISTSDPLASNLNSLGVSSSGSNPPAPSQYAQPNVSHLSGLYPISPLPPQPINGASSPIYHAVTISNGTDPRMSNGSNSFSVPSQNPVNNSSPYNSVGSPGNGSSSLQPTQQGLVRADLSFLFSTPLIGDLLVTHGLSGRTWKLHSEVLSIHTSSEPSRLVSFISGTYFPEASVQALVDYIYCKPLADPSNLRRSCLLASHVLSLWKKLSFENYQFLLIEFATTIIRPMPYRVACDSLLDLWGDEDTNWTLEDPPIQILASFVRGTCREDFLALASNSELASKRLVPLVSNISALLDHYPLEVAPYVPSLPEVRLIWHKTTDPNANNGIVIAASSPGEPISMKQAPEQFLKRPNDYIFGFEDSSTFAHCWVVASGVYLWDNWAWFRNRVAPIPKSEDLIELPKRHAEWRTSHVLRMPSWMTANILISILNTMFQSSPAFLLTELEAVTLLEHAKEMELVDSDGVPTTRFMSLLQQSSEHSFPPLTEKNIISHYAKYHKLGITPKLDELAGYLAKQVHQGLFGLAELDMEIIADLFSRIKRMSAKMSTHN